MQCKALEEIQIYQILQDRCLDEPGFVRPVRQTVITIGGPTPGTLSKALITMDAPEVDLLSLEGELWAGVFLAGQRSGIYRITSLVVFTHGIAHISIDLDSKGQAPFTPADLSDGNP